MNNTADPSKNWNMWPKGKMFKEITQNVTLTIDRTYKNTVYTFDLMFESFWLFSGLYELRIENSPP